MKIRNIQFKTISRPLRTLFSTSLGRKSVLSSVLVKTLLEDGSEGLGEVPTSFAVPQESLEDIQKILTQIIPLFIARTIEGYQRRIQTLRKTYDMPMTMSGLETSLFRAKLATEGKSERDWWGGKLNRLETDITIPFITAREPLEKWLRHVTRIGFCTYKVKVSGTIEADLKLLRLVWKYLDEHLPTFILRIDGNQGYTAKSYLRMADRLAKEGMWVELFEQPLPKHDFEGMRTVKKRSPMPIILDESVFTVEDVRRVIEDDLGDGINIKLAKSGIAQARTMIRLARRHNLRLMIGCMTETMVGLSAGIHCAAGTGKFDFIDLDGVYFLHGKQSFGKIRNEGPEYIL